MSTSFEDEYLDVLQNIESSLVASYQAHADMLDYDALNAVDGLIRKYQAEARGRAATVLRLNPTAQEALHNVEAVCNWRLGRSEFITNNQPISLADTSLSLDEMIACLKRIRSSIQRWNKEGGQRGYFNFVSHFVG